MDSYHVRTAADSLGEEHHRVLTGRFRRRVGDRAPIRKRAWGAAPGVRAGIHGAARVGRGA